MGMHARDPADFSCCVRFRGIPSEPDTLFEMRRVLYEPCLPISKRSRFRDDRELMPRSSTVITPVQPTVVTSHGTSSWAQTHVRRRNARVWPATRSRRATRTRRATRPPSVPAAAHALEPAREPHRLGLREPHRLGLREPHRLSPLILTAPGHASPTAAPSRMTLATPGGALNRRVVPE